jgi:hypothetical protein
VWPMFKFLSRSGAVRDRLLRHGEDGTNAIGIAYIEEHTFRGDATHPSGFQVDDEEGLFPLDFPRIRAFLLQARDDSAFVIAKIDSKLDELIGAGNVFNILYGANSYIYQVKYLGRDSRLNWRNGHSRIVVLNAGGKKDAARIGYTAVLR